MNSTKRWLLEITWIMFALFGALVVVFPIYRDKIQFEWINFNFIYVVVAILLVKHLFFFRHHPLQDSRIFKVLLICLAPFCFFPVLEGIHSFLEFNDREGLQSIMQHLSVKKQNGMMKYIRFEYLLSSVICLIGIFAMIVKMIRSLWRQYRFGKSYS